MSATVANEATPVLFIYVIIILVVIVRTIRNYTGVQVTVARTVAFTIFYFVFGAFLVAPSYFEGVSLLFIPVNIAVLALAAIWSYRISDKRITFWKNASGAIYLKGGIIIYLIYLAGLITRLAVDFLVIGQSAFDFNSKTILSSNTLLAAMLVDLIIMLGIGLVIGRNFRIYERYNVISSGEQKPASSLKP